jgi:CBS domain-containing protein
MSLGALFTRKPVTAGPKDSLSQATQLMKQHNVGAVVVVEHDRPVGILTDRDVALAVCLHGASAHDPIQKCMTAPVETVRSDASVYSATERMRELAVRRLPVVNHAGVLIGIVTLDDLLALISRELRNVAEGVRGEVATP